MQIEHIELTELKPYEKNAKKHPPKQVDLLAKNIQRFGFTTPVLVDKDNSVIAGHGRLLALKQLGHKDVPCVRMEHLTPDEVKALRLADNKIAELGEWDMDLAIDELKELDTNLLELTGFDKDLIIEPDEKDDEVPDVPVEPQSKLGDLYELGEHRVLCGDSTKLEDVERLMDGKKADMVFTDPPYGVSYQSNRRTKTDKFDVLDNDQHILTGWIPLASSYSNGFMFIWTTWKVIEEWNEATKPLGELTNLIVWYKKGGGIGDLKHTFTTDYEMAMVFGRGAEITGKRIGSVWTISKDFAGSYQHPTQKPVELGVEAITNTTHQNDIVMDLFLGSGSTLIASEKTGRICYGMELDPKYIDVIVQRYVDYTGNKNIIKNGESIVWQNSEDPQS